MANEPGKVPNLNTLICRLYVHHRKKTRGQRTKEIWIPLQSWWFPPRNHETSSVMVRFMKGAHHDIRKTFSNFYQGMVRPYHGTTPGVLFSNHVFHFLYSCQPSKQRVYGWLLPHISLKYLPIPCKRHENVLNNTSMVFQTVLVHLFMHRLFEFELCPLMTKKCT